MKKKKGSKLSSIFLFEVLPLEIYHKMEIDNFQLSPLPAFPCGIAFGMAVENTALSTWL